MKLTIDIPDMDLSPLLHTFNRYPIASLSEDMEIRALHKIVMTIHEARLAITAPIIPLPEPPPVVVVHVPMDRLDHIMPKLFNSLSRIQNPRAYYRAGDELQMSRDVIAESGKEAHAVEDYVRQLFPTWFADHSKPKALHGP